MTTLSLTEDLSDQARRRTWRRFRTPKRILQWIILPSGIAGALHAGRVFLEGPLSAQPAWGAFYEAVMHAVTVFPGIGFAVLIGSEVMKLAIEEQIGPMMGEGARSSGILAIDKGFQELARALRTAIGDKPVVLNASLIAKQADIEKRIINRGIDASLAGNVDDPLDVRRAKEIIAAGQPADAIPILESVVRRDPSQTRILISALIKSEAPELLQKAEELLPQHGDADQYQKIAYNYWKRGNVRHAITVAEAGMDRAKVRNEDDSVLKNSLAYYYADAKDEQKREVALQYAAAEEKHRRDEDPSSLNYAQALDTLGYVRIRFAKGKEDVERGMGECIGARQTAGIPYSLFFKHMKAAEEALAEIEKSAH